MRNREVVISAVVVIAVLLILAIIGYLAGRWEAKAQPTGYDARIIALNREAAEEAYRNQIVHLFGVWMRDDAGQPERARVGARKAKEAYIRIMTEMDRQEGK